MSLMNGVPATTTLAPFFSAKQKPNCNPVSHFSFVSEAISAICLDCCTSSSVSNERRKRPNQGAMIALATRNKGDFLTSCIFMGRKQFWQLCTNRDCGGTGMQWIHAIVRIPNAKGSLIALNHRLRWLHSRIKYTGQTLQSAVAWLFSISCSPVLPLSCIQGKSSLAALCCIWQLLRSSSPKNHHKSRESVSRSSRFYRDERAGAQVRFWNLGSTNSVYKIMLSET